METIKASSLFTEQPEIASIPRLQVFKNKMAKYIAQDEEIKIKLHRAIDSMKQGTKAFPSLSDLYWHEKEMLREEWGWTEWKSWVPVVTGILIVALTIQVIYLTFKMKSLLVALTLLKVARAQEILKGKIVLGSTEALGRENVTQMSLEDLHGIIRQTVEEYWLVIIGGLAIIMIGGMVVRTGIRKWSEIKKRSTLTVTFCVHLQAKGEDALILRGQSFRALSSDLILETVKTMSNVQVKGHWAPTLTYQYEGRMIDVFMKEEYEIKTCLNLTWREARIARRIVTQGYSLGLLILEGEQYLKPRTGSEEDWKGTTRVAVYVKNEDGGDNFKRRDSVRDSVKKLFKRREARAVQEMGRGVKRPVPMARTKQKPKQINTQI